MVQFLISCANVGYPRKRSEVIVMVQQICDIRDIWRVRFVSPTDGGRGLARDLS